MAKSELKLRAQQLRKSGKSIGDIAFSLCVSRSAVSLWCNGIKLSKEQENALEEKMRAGSYKGRLIGAATQRQKKLDKMEYYRKNAEKRVCDLSEKDLLMSFLGLYLGEGAKSGNCFQFVNSNPDIIIFCINVLRCVFNISPSKIYCNILLNELYKDRQIEIEKKWSDITRIPKDQFRKTVLIKSRNKKLYNNDSYLGTFMLRISKSSDLQYEILGLMQELLKSLNKRLH